MFKIWKSIKNITKLERRILNKRDITLSSSDIKYEMLLNDLKIGVEVRKLTVFFDKYNSLIFKNAIPYNQGYCIRGSKGINTFGLYRSVDVVFCDDKRKVIALYEGLQPNKITKYYKSASSIYILFSGAIKYFNIEYDSIIRLIKTI